MEVPQDETGPFYTKLNWDALTSQARDLDTPPNVSKALISQNSTHPVPPCIKAGHITSDYNARGPLSSPVHHSIV